MGLSELIADYPFPDKLKQVNLDNYPKWFDHRHEVFFPQFVDGQTNLIVELGSWVGWSTRWWCSNTSANVICIDHWKGSAEHSNFNQQVLDDLYNAFTLSCRSYKDKIIPIQMDTISGMLLLAKYNICDNIDLVYIDASHQYEDVITDIEVAYNLFPNATLIGDDYTWTNPTQDNRRTVKEAVQYFTNKHKLKAIVHRYLWAIKH